MRCSNGTVPLGLIVVFGLFLLTVGYVIAASLARREQPTFAPSVVTPRPLPAGSTVVDTLTVDARDAVRWAYVDLARRSVVEPPDTAGWDLAFRRFYIRARAGARDLGRAPFDTVASVPDSGYVFDEGGSDAANPALRRWYRYGFTSHLLEPKDHVYAVRTSGGRAAVMQILSYYCPGLVAGCVTVRYRVPVPVSSLPAESAPPPRESAGPPG